MASFHASWGDIIDVRPLGPLLQVFLLDVLGTQEQ